MANCFEEMGWKWLGEGEVPNELILLARLFKEYLRLQEMREQRKFPPPTSKRIVKSLPEVVIDQRDVQCPVCLQEFEARERAKLLPCKHLFHSSCILPWLGKTSTCPLCRRDLPTDDYTYELHISVKKRKQAREEEIDNLHNSMFS